MLSQKKRKKRAQHGVRNVELLRSKSGYGFTISGQQPCIINNIVSGSPADTQGMRDGDHLVSVNSLVVSQLSHDQVVRIIGASSGVLRLQIATASKTDVDSSEDEEYVKPRYTYRYRTRSAPKASHNGTTTDSGNKRTSRKEPSERPATKSNTQVGAAQGRIDAFPTIYHPMMPINGRASDFGVGRQSRVQESRVGDGYRSAYHSRGISSAEGMQLKRSNSEPDVSSSLEQNGITPQGLSSILYPAMQPVVISSSSTLNDDEHPSLRVIVGYIGSIEMPQDSNLASGRLLSIRSAVRRLRVEQKVHTLVLLEIRPDGIKLISPLGAVIVHYPVRRLAMSGMYPDDKRFFGLVTIQEAEEDDDGTVGQGSSCHVFMVDPDFSVHNSHVQKARTFGLHCTIDPNTHRCIEFPRSCSPILRTAAKLYKDKHGGIFEVPRRNIEQQYSSDSDTNSDSGLGFHKDLDESNTADRVYVVDVHIPDSESQSGERVISPVGASGLQRSQTPCKTSPILAPALSRTAPSIPHSSTSLRLLGGASYGGALPGAQGKAASRQKIPPVPARRSNERSAAISPAEALTGASDKKGNVFDIRATTPVVTNNLFKSRGNTSLALSPSAHHSLDPRAVEQLRKNMQNLLRKRQENVKDTHSLSDTESIISDTRSRGSSSRWLANRSDSSTSNSQKPYTAAGRLSMSNESKDLMQGTPLPHYSHGLYSEQSSRRPSVRDASVSDGVRAPSAPRIGRQRMWEHPLELAPTTRDMYPPETGKGQLEALGNNHKDRKKSEGRDSRASGFEITELDKETRQRFHDRECGQPGTNKGDLTERPAIPLKPSQIKLLQSAHKRPTLSGFPERQSLPIEIKLLDSRLSPRAFPSTAPKPQVSKSERSAFQKVSPDAAQHQYHVLTEDTYKPRLVTFAGTRQGQLDQQKFNSTDGHRELNSNHNNNNKNSNNNNNDDNNGSGHKGENSKEQRSNSESDSSRHSTAGNQRPISRPVPAPRKSIAQSARSQSVIPLTHSPRAVSRSWHKVGREVNVDDGTSVRSESVQSLDSAGRHEGRHHGEARYPWQHSRPTGVAHSSPHSRSAESLADLGVEGRLSNQSSFSSSQESSSVGRVARWAVGFENLLHDNKGVEAFTEFLKKEYSQENIKFWLACEQYRSVTSQPQRLEKANEIYTKHLSITATEPVNIDSNARKSAEEQLSSPSPSMFTEAQNQVFTLMKTDSYSRFIKSEYYQSCLMKEFESESASLNTSKERSKSSMSESSEMSDTQKRGRTLPSILKDLSRTLSHKTTDNSRENKPIVKDATLERSKSTRASMKKSEGTLHANLSDMKRHMDSAGSQDEGPSRSERDEVDGNLLCRVLLPDGSTTVIQARAGETLRSVLSSLFSKKADLSVASVDVFPLSTDKAVDISADISQLDCQEFRVEKRALFRIDLPNRKSIGVKAKPQRSIRDVMRPILNKYGFNIDNLVVLQGNQPIKTDNLVLSLDNSRVTVLTSDDYEWGFGFKKSHTQPLPDLTCDEMVDFERSGDTKKNRPSSLFGMLKSSSVDDKHSLHRRNKMKVTFGPNRSIEELESSFTKISDESFLDILTKAQNSRFDDQRGVGVDVGELPQFLKSSGSEHNSDSEEVTSDGDNGHPITATPVPPRSGHLAKMSTPLPRLFADITMTDPLAISSALNSETPARGGGFPRVNQTTPERIGHVWPHRTTLDTAQGVEDLNSTIVANKSLDDTLTPGKAPYSPLPTNLPPPPQFENEPAIPAQLHQEAASAPLEPPPYTEAVNRSMTLTALSKNVNNNIPRTGQKISTVPGTRLSFAQQPIIINDEVVTDSDSDRSTPSPSTHHLVLSTEDQQSESKYQFYEQRYKPRVLPRQHSVDRVDTVKVTFV